MFFSIQKELFDILPDLTIGMVVAKDVDNTRSSKEIGVASKGDEGIPPRRLYAGYFMIPCFIIHSKR